jgi:predicted nucleic acid-binding protein
VRFWDSSAIVPLLVPEQASERLMRLHAGDPVVIAWWGAVVECVSAVARAERGGLLAAPGAVAGLRRLVALSRGWHEVEPCEEVRETAKRLLRVHDLRAADSLQLAAALVAAESRPASLEFVCLDDRLRLAAGREGFAVLPPAGHGRLP